MFLSFGRTIVIESYGRGILRCQGDGAVSMGADSKPKENIENPKLEEEDVLTQHMGKFGKWQLLLTFFLSLFNVTCTFHIFSPTFEGAQPDDFWCARPSNLQDLAIPLWKNISGQFSTTPNGLVYDPCRIKALDYGTGSLNILEEESKHVTATRTCSNWEYDTTTMGPTTVTQWSLVCQNKEWANIADMLFLFGVTIGGFTGSLADKFGRKRIVLIAIAMQATLGLMIAFVPWFSVFLVLRVFLGFFCVSLVFTGFVLCMELVNGKWLTISGVCYYMPVSVAYMLTAGIAYLVRGWRHLQLVITLPSIVLGLLCWFLPESPRWLLAMGEADKAMEVVETAAKFNKQILSSNAKEALQKVCTASGGGKEDTKKGGGSLSVLLGKNLRMVTLVLSVAWFNTYFLYYGLVLNLSHLGGNVYLNSLISGGVELPAVALSIPVLLKLGRKWPICLTMVIGGLACISSTILPAGSMGALGLAMVAKTCVSATNVMLPVYTAELFPTLVRNFGIGVCNIASGASLMIIPYLWNMTWMGAAVPMCLLGAGGIIGGSLVLVLPETNKLSDNLNTQ